MDHSLKLGIVLDSSTPPFYLLLQVFRKVISITHPHCKLGLSLLLLYLHFNTTW